ncbi:putative response regulator component of a two-component regulatory system [Bradyrhizobium sp. ORS 285]|uniref:GGDEF domain-containing response regulator n=1 Tax=Bradyrhizobium sp. ORS 285 TaxID=115808 RepID=UPI000240B178|nr:diguanylate cyclase [Bradyrhizobium sp. ORS 285]CCD85338.1 putative response regulator component of a two-component regulatory system [Bradyrhizobium sp. ORS 285]SMX61046.1 putative response regulator component of a two-component regulatory system [Bradyrhizobium sp. ORS 285]
MTGQITPPKIERDSTRQAPELPPIPTICVFEPDSPVDSVASAVEQLNYTALRFSNIECARSLSESQHVEAAIVSDELPQAIEICMSIPAGIPKILVASEPSLEFSIAAARADVAGMVRRPVQQIELADWLKLFIAERSIVAASVLIVDDEPIIAELHASILSSSGLTVNVATTPAEALTSIESNPPDLILMDVQMPEVDGIELAKIIRQTRHRLSVPIAFLSGEQKEDRQLEARRFGGDIFIKKPIDPKPLVSLVRLRADRSRVLRSLIERDSLTGLYNHGQFKERLIQEFNRSNRTRSPLSLVMIDIDHFKSVNDQFGHPVGDRVIRGVASLLTSRLRTTDIIGRYGGEEFSVLLLDTPVDAATEVIDNLRKMMCATPFDIGGRSLPVSFSAGVAAAANSATHVEWIAAADRYLYDAKRAGRNRVVAERDLAATSAGACRGGSTWTQS